MRAADSRIITGIYIHIPFCVSKCVYCDFLSAPADDCVKKSYIAALCNEICITAQYLRQQKKSCAVSTIFIGGGTPSVMPYELIEKLLNTVACEFEILPEAEVTIECNPGTLSLQKAEAYLKAGINRLSFGLQSANNNELRMLGRIHTSEQFEQSYNTARRAGFNNINIDIMSALPGQTLEDFKQTLDKVIAYEPEHISAYSLIVEEGTKLYENIDKYPPLPDEDTERSMYWHACSYLEKAGYHQYEISNFAKEGFDCRHNISYWDRKNYLGFGIGAASLFEECRYTNISDIEEYIKIMTKSEAKISQKALLSNIRTEERQLSLEEQMEEYFFLGLRKNEGVSLTDFNCRFNKNAELIYKEAIAFHIKNGLLMKNGDRVALTARGRDVSNVVMADFLIT